MNLKINRLQHVGMPVTDIAISKSFYEGLGFKNVMETNFDYEEGVGTVAMMKRAEIIVELYQMPEPELTKVKLRSNGRIDHIAFDVDDIDETFALLKTNGYQIPEGEPQFLKFWKNGCKYFFIIGPDGERLEFCQVL